MSKTKYIQGIYYPVIKEKEWLKASCAELVEENAKMKQALEEIREIADKACTSGCKCIDKTDILIKINEVLNDETIKN